ncbi:MAG: DUF4942 domain-containing protein [Tannerella sp.]|jgi:hypothetical protein|nr:DUF4942 domain-containing protein [Tannerella sp.]
MINPDFYPTPREVIEEMLAGVNIPGSIFLEPSAGNGNIVDYLNENGAKEVLVCEKDPDLATIAASKGRFMVNDFLTLKAEQISHIDYIVMNPPFSADEDHILHAWNIAPEGSTVISLCNENTVDCRRTQTQKQEQISNLIDLYGRKVNLGQCFENAERKTDVWVSCLWLYKPGTGENEFNDYFSLEEETTPDVDSGILKYNYIREIVNRYVSAIKLFDRIEPLATEINELTETFSDNSIKFGAYETGKYNYSDAKISRETYRKELQKQAWRHIFKQMNMDKYITHGVRKKINRYVETQIHVPFTMKNIYRMLELIVGTHESRMDEVIVEAFDNICSFAWSENCTGGEKWKTNSDYVVNRRFIIPYICESDKWSSNNWVRIHISNSEEYINDVVKALCYITGVAYENCSTLSGFISRMDMQWGQWYEWGFFRIRGYKKGTMHFEFVDEKVWETFNRRVAKIKGWALPQTSNATKAERRRKSSQPTTLF